VVLSWSLTSITCTNLTLKYLINYQGYLQKLHHPEPLHDQDARKCSSLLSSSSNIHAQFILLSGFPCSGLTYRATQLQTALSVKIAESSKKSLIKQVIIISNHSLNLSRTAYATSRAEKDARAAFYSEVKRAICQTDTIVIADGLNYIKGYRYQLFCEAKAAKTPNCVVHVGTTAATCEKRNTDRLQKANDGTTIGGAGQDDPYEEELFKNLVFRYEEPNGMTRWDSPLFVVAEDDVQVPADAIWTALVGSEDSLTATKIRPNAATVLKPATQADHLYQLDSTTSSIVSQILEWQKDHQGEVGGKVNVNAAPTNTTADRETTSCVHLPATSVTMPMLQRIRRQFLALNRQHTPLDTERIGPLFVDYLNDQFNTA
jgi:protein KTI12